MPVKKKEVYEIDLEEPEIIKEPEIRISKKTGRPVRELSELQKETLSKGRALGVQKKKQLNEGIDLQKKAEAIKLAKEEIKSHRDTKQQIKIANQKKMYEDALKDDEVDEKQYLDNPTPIPEQPKKEKKIKKKVIKYIEASSSDDEEEEEIIVKKKKKNKQKEEDIPHQILRQKLKNNLDEVKSQSMQQLMMPSYF